jgi:N,N-dimethylformamidase beta subunit-like, C-terminal
MVGAIGWGLAGIAVLAGCSSGGPPASSSTTRPAGTPRRSGAVAKPWQPELAVMPADVTGSAPPACPLVTRSGGWVRTEDRQQGDPFAMPPEATGGQAVVGYADRRSATCGDSVAVALSGPPGTVRLAAYRIGAYRGSMARMIWRSGDVPVAPRPMPALQPGTNMREADWPVSVRVPVTATWPPGFYLLVVQGTAGAVDALGPAIPLVVRDDVDRAPVLFTASTLTWNAYNDWGGYSLYHGPGSTPAELFASRSREASFRRPLTGSGYRQLVSMDLPVVRVLEQIAAGTGTDVAYTTDVDLDQQPSQLLRHAELVVGGHSEYWTRREYDALAVARSSGVNLAFFGANNLWWHTRLDTGPGGVQPDREIVYRVAAGDPTSVRKPAQLTLLWSQWPEHRDAAAMLGQSHAAIGVHGGYQLLGAPAWLLAGTGLRAGTAEHPGSTLPGAVGNEADGYNPHGTNPSDLTVVAVGVLRGDHGDVTASTSYYVAPSGAGVFAAGSTDWACGLLEQCFDQAVPAATASALRALTWNVVLAFAQPQAGNTHPSVPGVSPPAATLLTRLDPEAVGTYGAAESGEGSVGKRVHKKLSTMAP